MSIRKGFVLVATAICTVHFQTFQRIQKRYGIPVFKCPIPRTETKIEWVQIRPPLQGDVSPISRVELHSSEDIFSGDIFRQ